MKYIKLSDTVYYSIPNCYLNFDIEEFQCKICPIILQCKEKKETVEK